MSVKQKTQQFLFCFCFRFASQFLPNGFDDLASNEAITWTAIATSLLFTETDEIFTKTRTADDAFFAKTQTIARNLNFSYPCWLLIRSI